MSRVPLPPTEWRRAQELPTPDRRLASFSLRSQGSLLRTIVGCLLAVSLLAVEPATLEAEAVEADVVVYGGTSAGIIAALQTKRLGHSVILIEPSDHLGGMTTGGLGFTDAGDKSKVGGLAREFYRRIHSHYSRPDVWKFDRPEQFPGYRPQEDAMWVFEPHVARVVFESMLREANIVPQMGQRLERQQGVLREGNRLVEIRMESGEIYRARMFLDTTYEGDLMAASDVKYVVGRESNAQYAETLNGVQPRQNLYNHRFLKRVDPFVIPGDSHSGLIDGVRPVITGEEGASDTLVQAYCFRMCMTQVAANRVPFRRPADYDESRYEVMLRNFEAGDLRLPFSPDRMPNGKTDTNNLGAMSTDWIGGNEAYPEASYEERARIVAAHQSYQQGLMWTLVNHTRVPASVRAAMASWGLARDEFLETENWPPQLYIREARRMVGVHVMTEHDCRGTYPVNDSIGMGSYNMDSHNCQRYVTSDGSLANEGDVQVSPGKPYRISYRAIVPQREQAGNLLVPVCLSASHIAYGSIRMEPVFMVLGHSAATAAVQAIESGVDVQSIPIETLQKQLRAEGQVLE